MSSYGFIITRHVNSEKTNKYWNQCIKLIRTFYNDNKIVVIDDNSTQDFIKTEHDYSNVTYIQSEYPGRGELLPYVYYLKYKWFPSAVIIHDSLFIHSKIRFELFNTPILPLWHHKYDKENLHNILRISRNLTNNSTIIKKLSNNDNILGLHNDKINLCFGCQTYINLNFLEFIDKKYKIFNLVYVVRNRTDRCSLERVFGAIFCQEYPKLLKIKSLFGDILTKYRNNLYNFDEYMYDLKFNKLRYPFIKVWTGR
jgi:hypothetical protein